MGVPLVPFVLCLVCASLFKASSQSNGTFLNKTSFMADLLGVRPGEIPTSSRKASSYMLGLFSNLQAIQGNNVHGYIDQYGQSDRTLRFDIAKTLRSSVVRFVELSLYKLPSVAEIAEMCNASTIVTVVDIRSGQELSAQRIALTTVGWVKLVLGRKIIKRWIRKPKSNHGMQIKIPNTCLAPLIQFATRNTADDSLQPVLVVYCKVEEFTQDLITHGPVKRHIQRRAISKTRMESCRRRKLNIMFKDLGWDTWVIAPLGYSAYFCAGSCSDPNSSRVKSMYSRMQIMLKKTDPLRADGPCCVPNKLSSISLLYYGQPGESPYVLKKVDDMVVVECACL